MPTASRRSQVPLSFPADCKSAIPVPLSFPAECNSAIPALPSASRWSRRVGLQIGVVAEGCIVDWVGGEELEEGWLGGLGAKLEVAAKEVVGALVAGG